MVRLLAGYGTAVKGGNTAGRESDLLMYTTTFGNTGKNNVNL